MASKNVGNKNDMIIIYTFGCRRGGSGWFYFSKVVLFMAITSNVAIDLELYLVSYYSFKHIEKKYKNIISSFILSFLRDDKSASDIIIYAL